MANKELFFQDTPDHLSGSESTSSIGALWPPATAHFDRTKAFYTAGIIDCQERLSELIGEFEAQKATMQNNSVTRVQFRAVFDGTYLRLNSEALGEFVEAVIPLDAGGFGSEPVMVYLGVNDISRSGDPSDMSRVHANFAAVAQISRRETADIFSKTEINGYTVETLVASPHMEGYVSTVDQMFALYERFGWTRAEVEALLANSANIIGVARLGEHIVSAGIGEIASVPLGDSKLRIAEITEAATLSGHGSKGVYTAVSTLLLRELAHRSRNNQIDDGQIDVVFGECNGLSEGVLRVARIQGRIFAKDVGGMYGFPDSGVLYQQVPIGGVERHTPYNDLLPAFLTRRMLYEHY